MVSLIVNGGTPIGAAMAAATPFTVGGLESDDSGSVTFSDGTPAHNAVVSISGGVPASTTVNLSGLTDGIIAATLHLNNDPAGNSFVDMVIHPTLDQDTTEQAALHVPVGIPFAAGGAGNVSFSVTGVESDDTGTLIFRDDNPLHNVMVPIVGGVPQQTTVDLSGLAYGKITSVLTLNNDPSGNSFAPVRMVYPGQTLDLNATTLTKGTVENYGTVDVAGTISTLDGVNVSNETVSGTASALALDGNGFTNLPFVPTTSASVSLTTSHANDVIMLDVVQNGTSIGSISDTDGLTWHQRAVTGSGSNTIYEYYAIAPNALSADAITVKFAGTASYVDLNAFGVSGANTSSPFDTNASVPATPATGLGTVTTSNANDLILAGYRFASKAHPGAGVGWTPINASGGYYLSESQIVSSTQTALVATASTAGQNGGIVDAIVQASNTTSSATMTVEARATLDLKNTTITGGTLTNFGTADVTGGTTTTLNGVAITNRTVAAGPGAPLALDGNGFNKHPSISTSASVALTTSHANGVVILDILQNGATGVSVSDAAGLVWHQRAVAGSGTYTIYEYYAIAPSALSADNITVHFTGTASYVDLNAFGISGANTSSPFDTSTTVPATPATAKGTISTSNANDFIFAGYRFSTNPTPGAGAGWTAINATGGYYLSEYQVVSAAQSGLTALASSTDQNGGIVDAVTQAGQTTAAATATVDASSTLDLVGTSITGGTLGNSGTVDVTGGATSALNVVNVTNTTFMVDAGATLDLKTTTLSGGTLTNLGTVDVIGGTTSTLDAIGATDTGAALKVEAGTTLDINNTIISGGTLTNFGTVDSTGVSTLNGFGVTNSGLLEATAGTLKIDPALITALTNTGTLLATMGARLDLESISVSNSTGTVKVDAGSTLDLKHSTITGGVLGNSGTMEVTGNSTSTLDGISVTNGSVLIGPAPLAIDGNGFTSRPFMPSTSASVALTTSKANDVIIVDVVENGTSISSVNGVTDTAGLTWHQRAVAGSGQNTIDEYYAISPLALAADNITVNFTGTASYADANAFGISGANTAAPFDNSASVPATSAAGAGKVTTSNANDLILAGYRFSTNPTPGAGAGWTAINASGGYYLSEYQIVSAAQAGLIATASTADQNGGIIDAVVQAGPTTTSAAVIVHAGSTLDLNNATISGGTLTNSGTVDSTGISTLNGGVAVTNSSLLEATSGKLTIDAALTNTGNLLASGATLDITGAVTGNGTATIGGTNAVLEFGSASAEAITFAPGLAGLLKLDAAQSFTGTVAGLASGDGIDLANFRFSNSPIISNVTGTGLAGSTTNVTVHDDALNTTIALLNQYANQFAVDAHAYSLTADNTKAPNTGTLLQLAAHG